MGSKIRTEVAKRMLSCCCSNSICSWERTGAEVSRLVDEAEQKQSAAAAERSRMDVALLREQYRWTKEKQKHQTQVVLFGQDTTKEPGGGGSLFHLVPVCQSRRGSLESQVSEDQMSLPPEDPHLASPHPDRRPWRTHLGMHWHTCLANVVTPPHLLDLHTTTVTTGASSTIPCSSKSASQSESRSRGSAGEHTPSWASTTSGSFEELDRHGRMSAESNRKCSALSRQLSSGGLNHHQPPPLPSSSSSSTPHHYPFPRRKTQRMSETARRLGMYSSF